MTLETKHSSLLFLLRPFIGVALILLASSQLANASEPSLSLSTSSGSLEVLISDGDFVPGCRFELLSAKNLTAEGALRRPRRLASNLPTGSTLSALPLIRSKSGSTPFQVRKRCSSGTFLSNIVELESSPSGRSTRALSKSLSRKLRLARLALADPFAGQTFSRPVDLQFDSQGRLYVVQQLGAISRLNPASPSAAAESFLDLTNSITFGVEQGLLAMAFAPDFASSGVLYLHYTPSTEVNRLSRLTLPSGRDTFSDASSEEVLLDSPQATVVHNGGSLLFGPDGNLYLSLGDEGGANDPSGNGQNLATLSGSVLRLSVSNTGGYSIPADNPFISQADARDEIYAYGFRNGWKMNFDLLNGDLILADVGQSTREEVNRVRSGGNYGWNTREGKVCRPPAKKCKRRGFIGPLLDYKRKDGASITGGFVYRGSKMPRLLGRYIFADFIEGRIWSVDLSSRSRKKRLEFDLDTFISTFGQDNKGEIYLAEYGAGRILRLEQNFS